MSSVKMGPSRRRETIDRRRWLAQAVAAGAMLGSINQASGPGHAAELFGLTPAEEAEQELKRASDRLKAVTRRPLVTLSSDQFQVIGDASEAFMKVTLSDCESLASDFLGYYQNLGFDVKRPGRRLTLVNFLDERPFLEFARRFAGSASVFVWGFYSLAENWLVLFDFRNVPIQEGGAGYKNVRTLAHEGTHQLTYNTGLLNRKGDVPRAIIEGFASYSETRPLHGHGEPGQINGRRLDDLAHIQRRKTWISATDLLTDDAVFGPTLDHAFLAYAQGWLLVYYLLKTPARLPQFQAFLKTIYTRADKTHRLDDAENHFGDLDRLDQDLKREAIRLQRERLP
jgi:Protein of unknown function (DUF1570)